MARKLIFKDDQLLSSTSPQSGFKIIGYNNGVLSEKINNGDINIIGGSDTSGWTTIVKSSNQDVTNSDVVEDDTDLQFPVVSGSHYMIESTIVLSTNDATGDYKFDFTISSGTFSGRGFAEGVPAISGLSSFGLTASNQLLVNSAVSDLDSLYIVKIHYSFTPSSNGIFKYRFSNNTAGPGVISRTWKGSILRYKTLD